MKGGKGSWWPLPLVLLLGQAVTASSQTPLARQPFVRMTKDILGWELVPNFNGSYKQAPFNTNRWGMRDRDYEAKPPSGTFRIALVGSSFTMGAGVPEEKTHEWLLENRLNRERPGSHARYEILNFSVGGYGILQQVAVVDKKVFFFAPNAVILVIHDVERTRMLRHLTSLLRAGTPIEQPYLRGKLQEAGVNGRMEEPEMLRRLSGVADDIVKLSYAHIARLCQEKGIPIVGIAFPLPRYAPEKHLSNVSQWASEAGIRVVSLVGVYDGLSLDSLWLSPRDDHLNALGHQVIAERLYELLRSNDARALKLGFSMRK